MNPLVTGLLVFACIFAAGMAGLFCRGAVPKHHLSADTKDVVKLAMGLVATMTALVLGLLVASAKNSYDTQRSEVIQLAAKFAFLDRVLAHYGPETAEPRALLRRALERAIARFWPAKDAPPAQLDPTSSGGDVLYDQLQNLSPQTDAQRALKSQALAIAIELGQMSWLLLEQAGSSVSSLLLVIVVCWLAMIFASFGVFAPANGTVVVALMISALSVSCAIFLILELDRPFNGLIQISREPMVNTLRRLGK